MWMVPWLRLNDGKTGELLFRINCTLKKPEYIHAGCFTLEDLCNNTNIRPKHRLFKQHSKIAHSDFYETELY